MKWQINLSGDACNFFFPIFSLFHCSPILTYVDRIPVAHVKVSERANSVKVIIGHI